MTNERFGLIGWLLAFAVAVVSIVIGFVWFPALQANALGLSWWDAICRATGITRTAGPAQIANAAAAVPSTVVWNRATLGAIASGDAQRGKALAAGCAACHGAQGISPSEAFPNLAGLPAMVLYKQLEDYRSGKRENPIMQGMVAALDDQKVADVAAYFASLPPGKRGDGEMPALVAIGSPMRSIAPCSACHGPLGFKDGAPPLEGQKAAYLKAQLDAFATGARHNDINQQMREIARALNASERNALAEWYGKPQR
ncbi:MAG TPA: c-type cytochrome [Burkholderiales bacterium]|nr:c-type cytochrome [Burkholderiales bacterium]